MDPFSNLVLVEHPVTRTMAGYSGVRGPTHVGEYEVLSMPVTAIVYPAVHMPLRYCARTLSHKVFFVVIAHLVVFRMARPHKTNIHTRRNKDRTPQ